MTHAAHHKVIDAIGRGYHRTGEIADVLQMPLPEVWARLSELRKANVIRAEQVKRPGVKGRPPKLYRLNPWSEQPTKEPTGERAQRVFEANKRER